MSQTTIESGSTRISAVAIREWVQFSLLLFASVWAIYTFVWKEIWTPKSAPINISMNLELKEVGAGDLKTGNEQKSLLAVEMKISARNPSSRTIYLLPSVWLATGSRLAVENGDDNASFTKIADDSVNSSNGVYEAGRYFSYESSSTVAVGKLFYDDVLKPGETTSRTVLFYVPRDEYDLLDVVALMPTATEAGVVELEWKLDENSGLVPTMYRVSPGGERIEMKPNKNGNYEDPTLELQMAASMSQLSLWH